MQPVNQHLSGMARAGEQRFIQAFVTQSSVRALDGDVLLLLARRDGIPLEVPNPRSPQHRQTDQFSPFIADDHGWLGEAFENGEFALAGNVHSRKRDFGDERLAFRAETIGLGENSEPPHADKRV